jgi:glycosyltransferase involved in cell wall biosynthesis
MTRSGWQQGKSGASFLIMPQISVIIPTYNRAHCIGRALESVRGQGIEGIELVIGDDASTDGTVEVARGVFPDARVAVLERNSGAAAARNAAMRIAGGEFLAFLDSDDEWLPGKIAAQVEYLRARPEVFACATGHVFKRRDGRERRVVVENEGDWSRRLLAGQPFHGASTPVVRRAVLDVVGMQDESLRVLEDWDWMLRIARAGELHVLPEVLAVVHENGPSDADHTLASTRRFLEKHGAEILRGGRGHRNAVVAQHWENAARCFFRHGREREGCMALARSLVVAPGRNPMMAAAFPLALVDGVCGTRLLRRVLAARGGYSIV